VDISWVSRGLVIAKVGRWPRRKTLHVGGEWLLGDAPDDPDYVIYARYITHWQDGTPISDEEQAELLDRVVDEAAKRGWKFVIEW
jgi:Immunity protein 74